MKAPVSLEAIRLANVACGFVGDWWPKGERQSPTKPPVTKAFIRLPSQGASIGT